MAYVDETYFILDINIPSHPESDLDLYIDRFEKEILKVLLGLELYDLLSTETSQRITDLIEGKTYTVADRQIRWNGFQNDDKISLISHYTYCMILKDDLAILHNQAGLLKLVSDNAQNASPVPKYTDIWNKMYELYMSCYNFLIEHDSTYPEWEFTDIGDVNEFNL